MAAMMSRSQCVNTSRPGQNGRHFSDDHLKCIFVNENIWISVNISLKFVLKGRINYIPALVQIMARCRLGDRPLSEPMMVGLLTHILGLNELNQYIDAIIWDEYFKIPVRDIIQQKRPAIHKLSFMVITKLNTVQSLYSTIDSLWPGGSGCHLKM